MSLVRASVIQLYIPTQDTQSDNPESDVRLVLGGIVRYVPYSERCFYTLTSVAVRLRRVTCLRRYVRASRFPESRVARTKN